MKYLERNTLTQWSNPNWKGTHQFLGPKFGVGGLTPIGPVGPNWPLDANVPIYFRRTATSGASGVTCGAHLEYISSAFTNANIGVGFLHDLYYTGSASGGGGHLVGFIGRTGDTSTGGMVMYGGENRVNGAGTSASYGGCFQFANWIAPGAGIHFTGQQLMGEFIRSEIYQSDGVTPEYTGSNIGLFVNSLVGGSLQIGINIGHITGGSTIYALACSNPIYNAGSSFVATDATQTKNITFYHDGTNGRITTNSGRVSLEGTGGNYMPAGGSTNVARIGGMLYTNTTSVGTVNNTATTLMSYTLKATTLAGPGDTIRFRATVQIANNTNVKTIVLSLGGTTIYSLSAALQNGYLTLTGVITRGASGTAQVIDCVATLQCTTATTSGVNVVNGTENLGTDLVLKVTGTGTASNDLAQTRMDLEYLPAP